MAIRIDDASSQSDRVEGLWLNGFGFDQAFDGTWWEIRRGQDYTIATSTIGAHLRDEFRRRYGHLLVERCESDRLRWERKVV